MNRPCRGCGRELRFVEGENGKLIPLDAETEVYEIQRDLAGDERAVKAAGLFVSHFRTCPKANQFSGSAAGRAKL